MSIIAIVQARMGSTRLPGKVMKDLAGKPMLLRVLTRISAARILQKIVVAISQSTYTRTAGFAAVDLGAIILLI